MTDEPMPTGDQSIEEVRQRIQGWLMEEGWSIGQADVPDAAWTLTGKDPVGRHIIVAQRANRSDQVLINGSVSVSKQHLGAYNALSQEERGLFAWEIQSTLLSRDIEFSVDGDPPSKFLIAQRIYYDGLTKDAFLQRVSEVRRAVTTLLMMYARKFQPAPKKKELGFKTD